MEAALKTIVFVGVNITYIFALHNGIINYMGSLTKDIMNHLMA